MYRQLFQNVLRVSGTCKTNKKLFKTVFGPTVNNTSKQLIENSGGFSNNLKSFSSNSVTDLENNENTSSLSDDSKHSYKNPTLRKEIIDQRAQDKLDALIKSNPEISETMKIIELEVEVLRQDGQMVPSLLRPRDMVELVKLTTRSQRRRQYEFLFKNEQRDIKAKEQQLENAKNREDKGPEAFYDPIKEGMVYQLRKNFMFRRIPDNQISQLYNWNCLKSMMFGSDIVFDFGFENNMNAREMSSCAKQILAVYSDNRIHDHPFHVHFCNTNLNGDLLEKIQRFIPNIMEEDFPFNITPDSYLDVFKNRKLVYLTPHTNDYMTTYDPETVYIIGALVDKVNRDPVTLAKAKREGIQMLKLPLEQYLEWGEGSNKNLTINQVFAVMLDAQRNKWEYALRHIPRRKLIESRLKSLENRIKRDMIRNQNYDNVNYLENLSGNKYQGSGNKMWTKPTFHHFSKSPQNMETMESKKRLYNENNSDDNQEFSHSARSKHRNKWKA